MGNRRTLIVIVAVVLAVGAGVGAYLYVSKADERARKKVELVEAFVAKQDIARGTSGREALDSGLIGKQHVPRGALPPNRLTKSNQIRQEQAVAGIAAGQFIVNDSFSSTGRGGFTSSGLPKDKVAVTVSVDPKAGVGGRITEGDSVNVIVVAPVRKNPAAPFDAGTPDNLATYIVQGAKVIGVGQETGTTPTTAGNNANATPQATDRGLVTLEVDPVDAERIAFGQVKETLYLTLLGPGYTAQALPYTGDVIQPPPLQPLNHPY